MKLEHSSRKLTRIFWLSISLLILYQCTKEGANVGKLDRSFKGTPDSTHFSPFYDVTTFAKADLTPDVNDKIEARGVQSVIKEYCGVGTCHGGPIAPKLSTYAEIRNYTVAGEPLQSKLWNLITTNDLDAAMPLYMLAMNYHSLTKPYYIIGLKMEPKKIPDWKISDQPP